MLKLNDLKLKKGDSVFFYRHWIGITESPVYFYIQEYFIENIGNIRILFLKETFIFLITTFAYY